MAETTRSQPSRARFGLVMAAIVALGVSTAEIGVAGAQDGIVPGDSCFGVVHFPDEPIGDAPSLGRIALTVDPAYSGSEVGVLTDIVAPDGSAVGATTTVADDGSVDLAFPLFAYGPLALTAAVMAEAGSGLDPAQPETLTGPGRSDIDLSALGELVVDDSEPVCDSSGLTAVVTTTSTSTTSTSEPPPSTTAAPTSTVGGTRTRDDGDSTGGRGFPWVPSGLAILAPALIGAGVYFSKYRRQGWDYSLRVQAWEAEESPSGLFPWYSAFESMIQFDDNPWAVDLNLECRLYVVFRLVRNGVPETSHITVEVHGDQKLGGTKSAPGAPSASLHVKRDLHKEFDAKQLKQLRGHKMGVLDSEKWLDFKFAKKKRPIISQRTIPIEQSQEADVHGQFIFAVAVFAEKAKATSEVWKAVWTEVDGAAAAGIGGLSTAAGAAVTPEGGPVAGFAATKATSAALTTIYDAAKKGLQDQPVALVMPTGTYSAGKQIPLIDPRPPAQGTPGAKAAVRPGLAVFGEEDVTYGGDDAPHLIEVKDAFMPKSMENFPEPPENESYWTLFMGWRVNLYMIRG